MPGVSEPTRRAQIFEPQSLQIEFELRPIHAQFFRGFLAFVNFSAVRDPLLDAVFHADSRLFGLHILEPAGRLPNFFLVDNFILDWFRPPSAIPADPIVVIVEIYDLDFAAGIVRDLHIDIFAIT